MHRLFRFQCWFLVLALIITAGLVNSCSPIYVIRAGWEEAGILLRRQEIDSLVEAEDTDSTLRRKLELVVAARNFAQSAGFAPDESFTQYSELDRDVLIWVLTASPKTELSSVTWWFPIVGSFPYKGFFDKEDALAAAKELQEEGHDTYLRTSPAFSTLGWFNDPLLSTTVSYDDVALVNTVLHELLHNTVWINNHVSFNETLANAVGSIGAKSFFRTKSGQESALYQTAANRWHDEQLYARFLAGIGKELRSFYSSIDRKHLESDNGDELLRGILAEREKIFQAAYARWQERKHELKSKRYGQLTPTLNNAVIVAQQVYYDRLWLFADFYELCGNSLEKFIDEMILVEKNIAEEDIDPFEALTVQIAELRSRKAAQN